MAFPVRIVLVKTFHPGNIGAVARAMKTMGLEDLVLVAPKDYPHDEATSRAVGAVDVLGSARVVDTLDEALADCQWVIATSARKRGYDWPMQSAKEAMRTAVDKTQAGNQVAIMFGPERSGLDNACLQRANIHAYIPASETFGVLNMAAAAQLFCYEYFCAAEVLANASEIVGKSASVDEMPNSSDGSVQHATQADMTYFYEHLTQVLQHTGFLNQKHDGDTLLKLKRMFNRAQMEEKEMRLMRGVLSSIKEFHKY